VKAVVDRSWTWLSPAIAVAASATLGGALAEGLVYAPDAQVALVGAARALRRSGR
jgi:hypothetical protein